MAQASDCYSSRDEARGRSQVRNLVHGVVLPLARRQVVLLLGFVCATALGAQRDINCPGPGCPSESLKVVADFADRVCSYAAVPGGGGGTPSETVKADLDATLKKLGNLRGAAIPEAYTNLLQADLANVRKQVDCRAAVATALLDRLRLANDTVVAVTETLQDRCAGDVAIVPRYDVGPSAPGTLILKRGAEGNTSWTAPIQVTLDKHGAFRWWCATVSNLLDPGTWRVADANVGIRCIDDRNGGVDCHAATTVKFPPSYFEGWVAERARCADGASQIRMRLDPDRRVVMECIAKR